MILHIDDRLLHGKVLFGWSALEAERILLISERLVDAGLAEEYRGAAQGRELICLVPGKNAIPQERPADFWLADHPRIVRSIQEAGRSIEVLKVIGLRGSGEILGPDFSPDEECRKILSELAREGLRVEIQPFPTGEAMVWPA